jgi:SAM-dependent methyltransferase
VLNAFAQQAFGFYALSFELGGLQTMVQSTIGQVIRVGQGERNANNLAVAGTSTSTAKTASANTSPNAVIDLYDWPVQNDSLDYIVMPHVLEFSQDPHAVLREAARCLRPGGYLSLTAFNPNSLLGWQAGHTELGHRSDWLTRRRLIDWMQLLNLHADRGAFGQWRPMSTQPQRFERMAWLDSAGERWWPQLANVYALRVIKRSHPDVRRKQPKPKPFFVRVPLPAGLAGARTVSNPPTTDLNP